MDPNLPPPYLCLHMKKNILVIGKDPDILKTVLRLLNDFKKVGYHAIGASGAEEAHRLFEENPIDLVLLTNGLEESLTTELRDWFSSRKSGLPILQHYGGGSGLLFNEIDLTLGAAPRTPATRTVLHKAADRFDVRSDRGESRFSFSFGDQYREDRLGFGVLRVINDDVVFPSQGFGSHPHDNMEIISIVQEGELTHRDSLQNEGVAQNNRLQIISAGTGIFHSEYNMNPDNVCRILQIWVYPNRMNITPRYQQADYIYPSPPNQWQTIIEPLGAGSGSLGQIQQDAWFSLGQIEKGQRISYTVKKPGNGVYVFLIDGRIQAEGETLEAKDGLGITGADVLDVTAVEASEVLLIEVPMVQLS